jgi:flagellar biosynthesis chaperone FliJ
MIQRARQLSQLETVRERQKADAARVLKEKREHLMAGIQLVEAAQRAMLEAAQAREDFLAQLRGGKIALSAGGMDDVHGWIAAFDQRIVQANAKMAEVLEDVKGRRAAFDEARTVFMRAHSRLSGVHEMQSRERKETRAAGERREEDMVEESALRSWNSLPGAGGSSPHKGKGG